MLNEPADKSVPTSGDYVATIDSSVSESRIETALWNRTIVRRALLVVLVLLPALYLIAAIGRYGVDVPFADEFTFVSLYEKARSGTLQFEDLYAQHNEHRYFVPRLLLIGFANIADGNLRAQMFFSALLVTLSAAVLWRLIRRTVGGSLEKSLLLTFLVTLLLFSPVQAENWTWGFQFALFLSNLFFLTGLLVATSKLSLPLKFCSCAAIAAIATFSFGNGVLLWALTFPVGLLLGCIRHGTAKILWWIAWGAVATATMVLYFVDFRWPSQIPTLATIGPVDYFLYVTTFLGSHLSEADWQQPLFPAVLIGTTLLILYAAAAVYVIKHLKNKELLTRVAPWAALGAYAISNAVLAAVARIGLGVSQALDSRYTSFSLYLTVSIIGLAAILMNEMRRSARPDRESTMWPRTETALLVGLFALLLDSYSWGESSMAARQRGRLMGKGALLFSNVIDSGAIHDRHLIAWAPEARASANTLDRLGLLHPSMLKTADIAALRTVSRKRTSTGFLDSLEINGQECLTEGWAVIPRGGRPADCVVLAYEEPGGGPIAFRIADEIKERPDVAASLDDRALQSSGWRCRFERSAVPPGPHRITAWAFDAKRAILYPLGTPRILP